MDRSASFDFTYLISIVVLVCLSICLPSASALALQNEEQWKMNPSNGHYYTLTHEMNWLQAEARATELGGHLVTINNREEELWLRHKFGTHENFYLGFNDLNIEGDWEWVSGEPVTYTNWWPGEPNNQSGEGETENAAVMNFGGCEEINGEWDCYYGDGWNDQHETNTYRGIVERVECLITQTDDLWYFCGANPKVYDIEVELEAAELREGTFFWEVVNGDDKVEFENGEGIITKVDSNVVKIRSKGGSEDPDDVLISLEYDDGYGIQKTCYHSLEVRKPTKLVPFKVRDELPTNVLDCPTPEKCECEKNPKKVHGYMSRVYYQLIDQFEDSISDVWVHEIFVGEWEWLYPEPGDWDIPELGSDFIDGKIKIIIDGKIIPGLCWDVLCVYGMYDPRPVYPEHEDASIKVRRVRQWITVGSKEHSGCLVKLHWFVNYLGYGRHEDIEFPN